MSKTLKINVQLSDELQQSIADWSATSGQSVEAIAHDALRHYINWRAEQQRDLEEAIAAADRGEFASANEVKALFARYDA